jgi:D-alanyl-D-alanine carboxypeptidase/D-alanyl-D-alanine-endopeptidase (penicillin-binding protein 4)
MAWLTLGHCETRRKRNGDKEESFEKVVQESWQEVKEVRAQEEKVARPKTSKLTNRSRPRRYESPRKRAFVINDTMRYALGSLLIALFACTPAATRGGRASASLAADLARALAAPALAHSGAALVVLSLDRGDTLFAREPDRLYTPASNLKLFTAASALHWLGPDYRFRTPLLATGSVHGDTLVGDLVLVGRGDPDLRSADLAALADSLAARGIRVVSGDVRADASWFDSPADWGSGWMWDDGPYWYWPWISALTLDDNVVTLVARPGRAPGDPLVIVLDPPTAYVDLRVSATTGAADDRATFDVVRQWMPRPANVIEVTGVLPMGTDSVVEQRSVEDPALYAATVLKELLSARGIEVLGEARYGALMADEPADTVAVHVSDSLAVSIRNFLKISDNLSGEQLVKTIGAEIGDPPGSYAKGLAAERVFLAREVGLDTTAFLLADGSGVSRYNVVTTGQIARLLEYMAARDDLAAAWIAALPIAGVDGTLENRLRGTAAEGRARAKTGTLQGVTALSGYTATADGERLAFSLLMEFFVGPAGPPRAVQDSIVARLARFRR